MTNISALFALAPSAQPGQEQQPLWVNLFPIIMVMVVFYFVLIRPQNKKAKDHDRMMKSVKKGDRIVTSGGIVGVVVSVKDKTLAIRSEETKLEVLKSAISEVVESSPSAAASEA